MSGDDDLFEQGEPDAPPVIGPAEDGEAEPPAYLPAEEVTPPQDEVTVQLRRTEDGQLVLLAFTSVELLTSCLGEQQPWIAVPQQQVEPVRQACEAEVLVWDAIRAEENTSPER